MNLMEGTLEVNDRLLNPYWNVTSIVGSNFSYVIYGLIPPDTLDITHNLDNTSGLTLYDVCYELYYDSGS